MDVSPFLNVLPWGVQLVLAGSLLLLLGARFSCETFSALEDLLRRRYTPRSFYSLYRKYALRKGLRLRPRKKHHSF